MPQKIPINRCSFSEVLSQFATVSDTDALKAPISFDNQLILQDAIVATFICTFAGCR